MRSCRLVDRHSALKIDTPCSGLQELEFIHFVCTWIEVISVPKLSKVQCHWYFENPPVRFGYVPELCEVSLTRQPKLSRARPCAKTSDGSMEKTNVVWEPSKDFKHFNLKWLGIQGFEEEGKVTNYIRLVMERAVGLKKIMLLGEPPCEDCNDCEIKSQVDEASRRRVKEQLTHGCSSSVEIIMCSSSGL